MKKIKIILCTVLVVLLSCFSTVFCTKQLKAQGAKNAVEAVKDLYQFNQVKDLDNNMKNLKKITTDAVYGQLTIDNENRTLNTYLKFKGEPTNVNIQKVTNSYILYSIENKYIDSSRVFIFMYETDLHGTLTKVRECECLDFIQ